MPFRHRFGDNLDPRRLQQVDDVLQERARAGKWLMMFNAMYDIPALWSYGIDYKGPIFDGLIGAQLVNENWPMAKSLDNCVHHYLGYGDGKLPGPPNTLWPVIPAINIYEYAKRDASLHLDVDRAIWKKMEKENLFDLGVWEQKEETIRTLLMMRKRGVEIDQDLCAYQYEIGQEIMADIADMMELNPGSPKQLATLLIDVLGLPVVKETPNGNPSFDKEAMEIYDEILDRLDSPIADQIRTYRGWQKATTACYKSYLDHVSPDGRLRTNYHMHRTKTLRLSSSDPNLQQIPRESRKPWHGKVKRVFRGRPGYVLIEGDYGQLEFRLGAAYSKEPQLLGIFNDDSRDVFDEMTMQLEGVAADHPDFYGLRTRTKTKTYTINYGGGIKRLMHAFGISYEQAAQEKADFFANYKNLEIVNKHIAKVAKHDGKVMLWNGRYRHFANPEKESHKAFNSVMQGGAADIVERAMNRLRKDVDNEDECRMLLQVHDSVWFEVREDKVDEYAPAIKECMEDVKARNGKDFGVKFRVDVHPVSKAA